MPFLYLSHSILGAAALLSAGVSPLGRSRYLRVLAGLGVLSAAVLFFAPGADHTWRTTQLTIVDARVIGVAIGCAWVVLAAVESRQQEGRWDAAVLVGVACTGLAFLATGRWAVPMLLLWIPGICGLTALVGGRLPRLTIGLGTAGLTAGLAIASAMSHSWTVAEPLPGWPFALVASGAALYAVAGSIAATENNVGVGVSAAPLLVGAAFVLATGPARNAGPFASLAVLVVALASGLVALRAADSSIRWIGLWIVAAMTSVASLSFDPYSISRAAAAAILAVCALALWPSSFGRAQIERGALVSVLALTAGFNAVAAAGSISFHHAIATDDVTRSASWAAVTSLLPATLALGIAIGARLARRVEPEAYSVPDVLATWALFVVAVLIGVFPFGASGSSGVILYLVAAAAGIVAARLIRHQPATEVAAEAAHVDTRPFRLPSLLERPAGILALVLTVGAVITVMGFAYQGLRVGFL